MPEKSKNYVGVCGVSSVDDAKAVASLIRGSGFTMQTDPVPMLGLQASYKTLKYGYSEGNKRVPKRDDLPFILEAVNQEVFPTIHYYTKEPEKLVPELEALLSLGSIYQRGLVDGVQINKVWPTPGQIFEIRSKFPQLRITLQMSSAVSGDMDARKWKVASKLATEYRDIDYLILDSSHGRGIEFDLAESISTHKTFREHGVQSRMVFAGGFSGDNVMRKASALITALGSQDFSIDAEGGLRDKVGEGYGNDVLNLDKVKAYLGEAAGVFLAQKR